MISSIIDIFMTKTCLPAVQGDLRVRQTHCALSLPIYHSLSIESTLPSNLTTPSHLPPPRLLCSFYLFFTPSTFSLYFFPPPSYIFLPSAPLIALPPRGDGKQWIYSNGKKRTGLKKETPLWLVLLPALPTVPVFLCDTNVASET